MSKAYLCPTPQEWCTGHKGTVNRGLFVDRKVHGSRKEAFRCYARYLREHEGLVREGRVFHDPKGRKPALVLSKISHFGVELRPGKGGKSKRFRPERGGGVIIG